MFKKIVSNLSFSPQVNSQLAYYAKRLRGEHLTRRLTVAAGLVVVVMQFVTIALPPAGANADSPNDIIRGGFTSKDTLIQSIDGSPELSYLYHAYFHISDDNIRGASDIHYIQAQGSSWLSLGRQRFSSSDQLITTSVGGNNYAYYLRSLSSIATTANASAITGTGSDGKPFAILASCGNIAVMSVPGPVSNLGPPQLTISKSPLPGSLPEGSGVAPGSTIAYRISFANIGQTAASTVYVEDPLPAYTTLATQSPAAATQHGMDSGNIPGVGAVPHVWWGYGSMPGGASGYYADFGVTIDRNAPNNTQICNTAYIRSTQTPIMASPRPICYVVKVATPVTVTPPVPTTPPIIRISPPPPPPVYVPPKINPPPPAPPHVTPPPIIPIITPVVPPPTPKTPHINMFKSALNMTQKGPNGLPVDASSYTAHAGDTIEYTLKTGNSGSGDQANFQVVEDLTDVLEYADVINAGGGTLIRSANGLTDLVWPSTTIKAGSSMTNVFQIRVKDPVPTTPRSISNPLSFDLQMDNIYANAVSIKVAAPPAKVVEVATEQLPQTGAGTDLLVTAGLFALIVYFYSRNRQLATEIKILRVEHNNPGV